MPKKPQCYNAFYYFMLDFQKKGKAKGKRLNTLKEVQADPECSKQWESMTKQQRQFYENLSKNAKEDNNRKNKLTGTGESISLLELEERKKQEFSQNMTEYIQSTVDSAYANNELHLRKFYLIHVNYFYVKEYGLNLSDYIPAEFALLRFSLKNGIEDIYHKIMYCKPDLGYTREAIEYSMSTHQIPCEHPGEKDYEQIYDNFMTFINRSKYMVNHKTPIFTMNKGMDVVKCLMNRIADAKGVNLDAIPVYSLELLFSKMRAVCCRTVIPIMLAEYELVKDVFSFTKDIECEFHKYINGTSEHCSMAIVKRWVYTVCDWCCESLNIKMMQAVHCPLIPPADNNFALTKAFSTLTISGGASETQSQITGNLSVSGVRDSHRTLISGLSLSVTGDVSETQSTTELASMSGVKDSHRILVSSRSFLEERRRRQEGKRVTVIRNNSQKDLSDTSEMKATKTNGEKQFTKSYTKYENNEEETFNTVNYEMAFPTIGGRGLLKQYRTNCSNTRGRGHGNVISSK